MNLYAQRGDSRKAMQVADTLVKREPNNAGFNALVGTARLQSGDRAGARRAFEQAGKLEPRAPAPQFSLARLDMAEGKLDDAAARLAGILKTDERNVEAYFETALLAERRGQRNRARDAFRKAADHSPGGDRRALLALAAFHARGNELQEALKVTQELSNLAPDDLAVLLTSARVLFRTGDRAGARTLLNRATRVAGYEVDAQIEIAMLQLAVGNTAGAAYSLEKVLSSEPDNLRANAVLADVLLRQGELDKADQVARRIVGWQPKLAVGYSLQGNVASQRGQAAAALVLYRKAHATQPSADTLLPLIAALGATDPAGATRLAEAWVAEHPRDARVRLELANAHARAGRFADARKHYEALLAVAPDHRDALNNLANALMRLRDPGALAAAERALAAYPGDASIIDTTAWAAFQAGQRDRALQLLRDARLRDPQNAEIRYHLARVLADAGRTAEARQEIEPILRAGQPFESMEEARAWLETLK